jgi:exopolysaccharide biosynthesis polyprenyl glycosylphosphotransferase
LLKHRDAILEGLTVLLDILLVSGGWLTAYLIRHYPGPLPIPYVGPPGIGEYVRVAPLFVVGFVCAAGILGTYRGGSKRFTLKRVELVLGAALMGWLLSVAGLYYYRNEPFSRWTLGIFLLLSPFLLLLSRFIVQRIARFCFSCGIGTEKVAVLGSGRLGRKLIRRLRDGQPGVEVAYVIPLQKGCDVDEILGVPLRGSVSEVERIWEDNPVETVLVALSADSGERLQEVLGKLGRIPVEAAFIPDLTGILQVGLKVSEVEGMPLISLHSGTVKGWGALLKRVFDLAVSAVLLVILSLPMAAISLAIKLTGDGPVLYRQTRMSLGGDEFTMLKFRSMRPGAEEDVGPVRAQKDDPRVTAVGRFLRRTSLDELPKLFNVLRGEMSLVGPRHERPCFVQQLGRSLPAYMQRHHVKAGITGWAQVNDLRQGAPFDKRWEYDLYYINNWSFCFDLFILLATPLRPPVPRERLLM